MFLHFLGQGDTELESIVLNALSSWCQTFKPDVNSPSGI